MSSLGTIGHRSRHMRRRRRDSRSSTSAEGSDVTIESVCYQGFHVRLESCMRKGLLCTTRVISIQYCTFAVRVLVYHSSHVCDKCFHLPLASQVCTTRVILI